MTESSEKLLSEEWDFTRCAEEELEKCHQYEYARASKKICQYIEEWREIHCDILGLSPWMAIVTISRDTFDSELEWIFSIPEFPKKPWLCFSQKERAFFCKERDFKWNLEGNLNALKIGGKYHPRTKIYQKGKVLSNYVFSIPWQLSNLELQKKFAQWLKQNRQDSPHEQRGSTSLKERLKFLGAYRLLQNYNWIEACDITAEQLEGRKCFYQSQQGWLGAKRKAEKEIKVFEAQFLKR